MDFATIVADFIDGKSQFLQALHTAGTDAAVVLADTAGENQRIGSAQNAVIRSDVFLDAVTERFNGQKRAGVVGICCGDNFPHIGTHAGNTQKPAFVVQHFVQCIDVQMMLTHQIGDDPRIKIADARAHDQPLQRAEAHGGVDGMSPLNSAHAGPVAQVAGNEIQASHRSLQILGSL